MEKFSALPAICARNSPVLGEVPAQRPVTRSFDVFFDLRSNKRLSKQWRGWCSSTQSCPSWRHRNGSPGSENEFINGKWPENAWRITIGVTSVLHEFIGIHYNDVIMNSSQITSLTIIYSIVYSRAYQRKHQSSASLASVWGIHRSPVNSPHKGPVKQKMFHLMTSPCACLVDSVWCPSLTSIILGVLLLRNIMTMFFHFGKVDWNAEIRWNKWCSDTFEKTWLSDNYCDIEVIHHVNISIPRERTDVWVW